ncbi:MULTISPECIES: hypothetical protein [Rummeliibacillus]|uniref:hypothetical protein n=1 Tax=Rummeliibacillus TaxID=648802 RepID=UPI0011B6097C|nr:MULTISPECIES: hypothetical protein [Rummeliibacillus]
MIIIELVWDLLYNFFTSVDFKSDEKKIKSKMKKIGKSHPALLKKYEENNLLFEDGDVAQIILDSPVKKRAQIDELADRIITQINASVPKHKKV